MLKDTPKRLRRVAIQGFVNRELADLRRRSSALAIATGHCCQARQLKSELARTHFHLSKLTGKAKEWALGKLVTDPIYFPDMKALKDDLRLAFKPPQDEHHHRSALLALKQGHLSMLYIISCKHDIWRSASSPIRSIR
ncbi:unnamed protein product [Peronospora belbahrii]|uniref:Uncharacterized protein n=1 Tax=Peronospora belbahrii TaxID=622444 RepID=A0AAU9LDS9_9STRA|nr:unnamed protein product [Peronospora belbahrii]